MGLQDTVTTVGIRVPRVLRFLEHPSLTRLESVVWSKLTATELVRLTKTRKVLLARHVSFASELLPTPITSLKGTTLTVWGPVGSSGQANVFRIQPRGRQWRWHYLQQLLRDAISSIAAAHTARRVDIVISTSGDLAKAVENSGTRAIVFPNTILDTELIDLIESTRILRRDRGRPMEAGPVRILCVGNLIYLKRFELAISALTDPRLSNATLVIIGKPAMGKANYLASIASTLGVEDRVSFLGQVPRSDVIRNMFDADVLFHPSTREGGSGVVGEATAVGLPVVCFGGTGASVVLLASGASGTELPPVGSLTTSTIARSLLSTASMPRVASDKWGNDRYKQLESGLLQEAWVRNAKAYP
ncbi:glycosyltransferase family 4 protein [Cryobacterium sp. 5B3]|uniref:glycosyltransferase family 4 protein n=1 Tax=Cryobacterium sp. 5B3 TaxID=3048586 RepID=UPI0034DD916D